MLHNLICIVLALALALLGLKYLGLVVLVYAYFASKNVSTYN